MESRTILTLAFAFSLMGTTASAAKTTINPHEGWAYMVDVDSKFISLAN
ncbi:hypothetical protein [Methanosarcina flavescens]|jgi:hypothetical protein|nr:hypothetical protein [Methanosarcina flavescens]